MKHLSVLLTNNALATRGGSETYVRDVALALLQRGHRPVVFSLVLGETAAELRRATIPVIDDLTRLGEAPDVIHGHHHIETLIVALTFPGTPVVSFCHGWVPWEELPLHHPDVRRYVAVDEVCVDRLVREEGIAPDRVELLLNFVDLDRFRPRPTLPAKPSRALVLSNAATTDGYARAIMEACSAVDIRVDIIGRAAGNASNSPETLLPAYDLVFAKGRAALEALAVGCATVLADAAGAGPLVTPDNYDVLRMRNFGIRELRHPHTVDWYRAQIASFCAASVAEVSTRVRAGAPLTSAIDRLIDIYTQAIALPPGPGDRSRAAALHCSRLAAQLKQTYSIAGSLQTVARDLELTRAELEQQGEAYERDLASARQEVQALRRQIAAFERARVG